MNKPGYFVLNNLDDFRTRDINACVWNTRDQLFHLAINHQPRLPVRNQEQALSEWKNAAPLVMDQFQQLGFLSADRKQLFYALDWDNKQRYASEQLLSDIERAALKNPAVQGPVLVNSENREENTAEELSLSPVIAGTGKTFVDLHLGGDGRVALIESDGGGNHALRVVHLSKRWHLHIDWSDGEDESRAPVRTWVDSHNRVWVAGDNYLALYEGEPLPHAYQPWVDRFEPLFINPNPLRLIQKILLPSERKLMALCANDTQLHLLMLMSDNKTQQLVTFNLLQPGVAARIYQLKNIPLVTDIASIDENRIFLQFYTHDSEVKHCDFVCVQLDGDDWSVEKRSYPMHSQLSTRLVRGDQSVIRYLSIDGPKQILPLPQARYVSSGVSVLKRVLDSGNPDTWWDRIYLDASIPSGCELRIRVNAFDDYTNPPSDWQLQPVPGKLAIGSELPFYQNRFDQKLVHQGAFEILLQRETGEVRDIRGRYLQLEIHMRGDGRHTPVIESLRVAYPRISWQENYLPPLFHQQQDVQPDNTNAANGADFRERVFALLDGMFSPLEKRIAAAETWLLPQAAPTSQLSVLAAMLGEKLPQHWPEARQRIWLACASELQRWKGTYAALCLALDIATDGAIARGQIVPVENYLMRRTLATIIGVDMDDAAHPLTLGTRQSGNSIVGETLFLSDESSREFVALLAPELLTASDKKIAADFIDHYAQRISIVVHKDAFSLLANIQSLLLNYVPVGLDCRIIKTDHPFILGLSPLLGIDTYLEPAVRARRVVLNNTWLGREGILRNQASFSPRDQLLGAQANAQ